MKKGKGSREKDKSSLLSDLNLLLILLKKNKI